jgi:DNA-binding CsgD family transcriptional regulator
MECVLCPHLVGRRAEMEMLTAALEAAGESHGGVVFITGENGVGKSRLAREISTLAARRGFQVLSGRGAHSAVPVPYRPVAEALLGAARAGIVPDTPDMPVVASYRAALSSLVPEWRRPGDADAHLTPVVVGEALLRMLARPGSSGGLLILEDLHWADGETLAIVEYLADNVASAPVLCLVTLRNSESSAGTDLLQATSARRVATAVDVKRLSPAGARDMAAACLRTDSVPSAIGRLLARCDGLPFAVEEVLTAAVASGELVKDEAGWQVNADVSTAVPDSIAGSVRSRLASLGRGAGDVIVAAAVLGQQFSWELLRGVIHVSDAAILDALQQACSVKIIEPVPAEADSFRFRHSLTREAILSDLIPLELASRARAAAATIERTCPGLPGDWCERAAELRELAGQPGQAAHLQLMAARRALRQGAARSAEAALLDARRLLADPSLDDSVLHLDVDEALVETYEQAGDAARLAPITTDLVERLTAAGADPRRTAMVRLRAASVESQDDPSGAADHLEAAASIASSLDDAELISRVDAVAAQTALVAGDFDVAGKLAHQALTATEAAGMSGWAAEVALVALQVIGRRERTRDLAAARTAFERSLHIVDGQTELGIWRVLARHDLATLEMLAHGCDDQLRTVRPLAAEAGASCLVNVIDLQLANLESLGANLEPALAAARQCQRSATEIDSPVRQALAVCLQANIAAIRGDVRESKRLAELAEQIRPGDPEIHLMAHGQSRVLAALFRDDIARALKASARADPYAVDALAAQHAYSALQAQVLAPRRALSLRALVESAAGRNGEVAIEQARAGGADSSWNAGCLAYAEAVLAGRSGDTARATALAHEGSEHFASFALWWNNLARRLVAPAALRDRWGDPAAWMRDAAAEFDATGHGRLASACRGVLRRAGERVPRAGRGDARVPAQMRSLGITSREMDVFLLVARGQSNSEIATTLCISPKTVETHVASLVAKIGTTGRRELVAQAARLESSV